MTTSVGNIKLQVFLINYGWSIACLLSAPVLFMRPPSGNDIFPFVLLAVSCVKSFTNRRKYILVFAASPDFLSLQYCNAFMKVSAEQFSARHFEDVALLRRPLIVGYRAALNIKIRGEWNTYYVTDKALLEDIYLKLKVIIHSGVQQRLGRTQIPGSALN